MESGIAPIALTASHHDPDRCLDSTLISFLYTFQPNKSDRRWQSPIFKYSQCSSKCSSSLLKKKCWLHKYNEWWWVFLLLQDAAPILSICDINVYSSPCNLMYEDSFHCIWIASIGLGVLKVYSICGFASSNSYINKIRWKKGPASKWLTQCLLGF